MNMMKMTNLNQQSLNSAKKTEKKSPLPRLCVITAVLGVAITSVSCAKKEVCLYEDKDYQGAEYCYDSEQANFVELGINDKISSLKVNGGVTAVLYQHINYGGFEVEYTEDMPSLDSNHDEQFSSLKIK